MKNCPKSDCDEITEKKHCASKNCGWYICEKSNIVFDPKDITKIMEWKQLP